MSLDGISKPVLPNIIPPVRIPQIDIPEVKPIGEVQFDAIKAEIQRFEDSLDQTMEVGIQLASFGASISMSVVSIEWDGPVIIFHGFVNDSRATLVQNMSQLNFLLLAVPRAVPEEPKKKIGFSAIGD